MGTLAYNIALILFMLEYLKPDLSITGLQGTQAASE